MLRGYQAGAGRTGPSLVSWPPGLHGDPAPGLSLWTCGHGSPCSRFLGRRPSGCECRGVNAAEPLVVSMSASAAPPACHTRPHLSPRCRGAVFRPVAPRLQGAFPAFMGVTFLCILPVPTKVTVASRTEGCGLHTAPSASALGLIQVNAVRRRIPGLNHRLPETWPSRGGGENQGHEWSGGLGALTLGPWTCPASVEAQVGA